MLNNISEDYNRNKGINIYSKKKFMKNDIYKNMFIDCNKKGRKINYDNKIFNEIINVNLINSESYLIERRNGYGFLPFKKYEKNSDGSIFFECNNGSTCVESKLFY